jgi:hypothetical protein
MRTKATYHGRPGEGELPLLLANPSGPKIHVRRLGDVTVVTEREIT